MAKVLIVSDQLNISKSIVKHLSKLNNALFQNPNVFYLSKNKNYEVSPISEVSKQEPIEYADKTTIREITEVILRFLEGQNEYTLILIDGDLVEKNNIFNPSSSLGDLSAFLYSVLLMIKNGKSTMDGQSYDIPNDSFAFFLYSDGEYSFSRLVSSLSDIYQKLPEEAKTYLPKEAIEPKNISYVRGGGKCYTNHIVGNGIISSDEYEELKLPTSYGEFIKQL